MDKYYAQSDIGHRISRTGTEPRRYCAWKLKPDGQYELLDVVDSFDAAKQVFETQPKCYECGFPADVHLIHWYCSTCYAGLNEEHRED